MKRPRLVRFAMGARVRGTVRTHHISTFERDAVVESSVGFVEIHMKTKFFKEHEVESCVVRAHLSAAIYNNDKSMLSAMVRRGLITEDDYYDIRAGAMRAERIEELCKASTPKARELLAARLSALPSDTTVAVSDIMNGATFGKVRDGWGSTLAGAIGIHRGGIWRRRRSRSCSRRISPRRRHGGRPLTTSPSPASCSRRC